jgi:hypothetical protein
MLTNQKWHFLFGSKVISEDPGIAAARKTFGNDLIT